MIFTNTSNVLGFQGESLSREITFTIDENLSNCDIYLEFTKPDGKKVMTEEVVTSPYLVPYSLLDEVGYLKAQLVAYRETDFIQKSAIKSFYIPESINASQTIQEENPSIINELIEGVANSVNDLDFTFNNETKTLTANLHFNDDDTTTRTVTINIDSGDKYITNVSIDYENEVMIFTFNDGTTISCDITPLIDMYSADNLTLKLENGVFSLSDNYKNKIDSIDTTKEGFTVLNGTSEAPIYLQDLETGNYILNGRYRPYEGAGISGIATEQIIEVNRSSSRVNVFMIDARSEEIDCFEIQIATDEYIRTTVQIPEITLNKMPVDDAMDGIYAQMQNQLKYENSVEQTTMIDISFPADMPNNYYSKLVFKTGSTIPTFNLTGTVKWVGDSITGNQLILQANKIYTINFEKDVFELVARVEMR